MWPVKIPIREGRGKNSFGFLGEVEVPPFAMWKGNQFVIPIKKGHVVCESGSNKYPNFGIAFLADGPRLTQKASLWKHHLVHVAAGLAVLVLGIPLGAFWQSQLECVIKHFTTEMGVKKRTITKAIFYQLQKGRKPPKELYLPWSVEVGQGRNLLGMIAKHQGCCLTNMSQPSGASWFPSAT